MAKPPYIVIQKQMLVVDRTGSWSHTSVDSLNLVNSMSPMIQVQAGENKTYTVVETTDSTLSDRLVSFRQLLDQLSPEDSLAVSRALQLLTWRRQHQFCGQCGRPTTEHSTERALFCKPCNIVYYPRISPCMMCLVARDDECLLAHHHRQPAGMYSTLAGFVEAGETLEQTLHREVLEEVGISVKNLRYFSSQSWPFPHQLMVAFFAEYEAGELRLEEEEIEDAQWFHYTSLPQIPPPSTLSGQLIASFVKQRQQFNSR